MTIPIAVRDFDALPEKTLLTCRQFCSQRGHRGAFPFSRSYWWRLVKTGVAPSGRKLPGKSGAVDARYWTAGEVRQVVDGLTGEAA